MNNYKQHTLTKGTVFAIIINVSFFLFLPYLTRFSSNRNLTSKIISASRINVVKPQRIIRREFKRKKELRLKKIKPPKPKIKKIKLKREPLKIKQKKLTVKPLQFKFTSNLQWGPKVEAPPVIAAPVQKGPVVETDAGEFDYDMLFDLSNVDELPKEILKFKPLYPYIAKEMGIEGYVKLEFTINSSGEVKDIKVIENYPDNIFDRNAINAVKRYKFSPAKLKGRNVNCKGVKLKISFDLEPAEGR